MVKFSEKINVRKFSRERPEAPCCFAEDGEGMYQEL